MGQNWKAQFNPRELGAGFSEVERGGDKSRDTIEVSYISHISRVLRTSQLSEERPTLFQADMWSLQNLRVLKEGPQIWTVCQE
jgi:hypothetical protein